MGAAILQYLIFSMKIFLVTHETLWHNGTCCFRLPRLWGDVGSSYVVLQARGLKCCRQICHGSEEGFGYHH